MSKILLKTIDLNGKEILLPIQNICIEKENGEIQVVSVKDIKGVEFEELKN